VYNLIINNNNSNSPVDSNVCDVYSNSPVDISVCDVSIIVESDEPDENMR